MGHQIVHDHLPILQTGVINLIEGVVEQKVKNILLPSLPRVLVAAKAGQQLGAGQITGHVAYRVSLQVGYYVVHQGGQDSVDFFLFRRAETDVEDG